MTMVSYIISLAKNVYACAAAKITWSISGKVIGLEAKSPRNVVKMKEEMAAFFVCGSVVFSAINWHDLTAIRSAHTVNRNFEFLCVVQIQRSIAVHNRKLKSRGINLIYLTPSCRKVVAYRFGRIFIDQNKYSDY